MANESNKSGGIGLLSVLFIVFLVLKLCHVIDWSWWWVTAPLWIPIAIFAVVMLGLYGWSKIYTWYKLRHDENFRKSWQYLKEQEAERKAIKEANKGKSGLQIRLEEMQRQAEEIRKAQKR